MNYKYLAMWDTTSSTLIYQSPLMWSNVFSGSKIFNRAYSSQEDEIYVQCYSTLTIENWDFPQNPRKFSENDKKKVFLTNCIVQTRQKFEL